ncbi:acyl-CoA carboxylase epsilon subunit [Streptomyces sp. NPDC001642]|uniref:acyl-CoA carboxylase epsilon subunit n=1 Tax=Streptomyces sp. NPDC001642 TaxID=3154392 RepID=UPI003328ADA7
MSSAESVFRVERGRASREELAALCAVLCAVLAARGEEPGEEGDGGPGAGDVWSPERTAPAYRPPRAWR